MPLNVDAVFTMDPTTEGWAVATSAPHLSYITDNVDGDAITGPPSGSFAWAAGAPAFNETIVVQSAEFTWSQLGLPDVSAINSVDVVAYSSMDVIDATILSGTLTIDIISGGNIVYATPGLWARNLTPGTSDVAWQSQAHASGQKVIAPYKDNSTPVRIRLTFALNNSSGSGAGPDNSSLIDSIDLRISYDGGQGPATQSATFNLVSAENWAEVGDTARITYSQDAANGQPLPCGKMTFDTSTAWGSGTTVFERARSQAYKWSDLGVPPGATVLSVNCLSYYWRSNVNIFLVSGNVYLDVVAAATGTIVHSAGDLDAFLWSGGGPAVPWSQRLPNTTRAVDVAYRPASTQVKMQVKVAVDNSAGGGEAGDYYEFDTIVLSISYVLNGVMGWIYTSLQGAQGHSNDT